MSDSGISSDRVQEYLWDLKPDYVPPHIQNLPKGEGFALLKILKFDALVAQGVLGFVAAEAVRGFKNLRAGKIKLQMTADLGLAEALKALNQWQHLEEFNEFFKPWSGFARPRVADTWDQDQEFGRQRLYGINPALIRQCQPADLQPGGKLPLPVAELQERLQGVLPAGTHLEAQLQGGRLYALDFEILSQILTPALEDQLGRYAAAPFCLLWVNEKSELLPLAIRLRQGPGTENWTENPIFTPNSPAQSWLTAKLIVSAADATHQGIISHLLYTHLIVETFAVSTLQHLPPEHTLYQLLYPHFFNTLAINEMARGIFLGHGGFFDGTGALGYTGSNELLRRGYTGSGENYQGEPYQFYQRAFPFDLAARWVENLPGYHYRDDGLLIWQALETYITEILRLSYPTPEALAADPALQAWKQELLNPKGGRMPGLLPPEKSAQLEGPLTELTDLVHILTNVIFTATAQHSAVNFGQYEYGGWVPNLPFAIYGPFGDLSSQEPPEIELVHRLPSRIQTIKQMVLLRVLSLPAPHSSPSLLSMRNPFKEPGCRKVFEGFKQDLRKIEQKITMRNQTLEHPYVRLLPSKIAQSIAI